MKYFCFFDTGPDAPLCLRFWTHMFGNGVGTLSILISDTRETRDREIWSLTGEASNAWYQAEVTVSTQNSFKVRITSNFFYYNYEICYSYFKEFTKF